MQVVALPRHSREGGNPVRFLQPEWRPIKELRRMVLEDTAGKTILDSRLRGNDGVKIATVATST
jgi:hypothetical protein